MDDTSKQAFPRPYGDQVGMTIREVFACAAMQGMLSNSEIRRELGLAKLTSTGAIERMIAIGAVAQADALIAELDKSDA